MATNDLAANSEITAKPAEISKKTGKPKRKRRGPGKPFKKGQSGNPSGRPKQVNELRVFLYDLRLQSFTEPYNAISSDGVSLTATVIVRFRLHRDAVPVLHQAIGPNYVQVLAQPGIGSLTRHL